MSQMAHCPALLISAPSSGQGKTTVTAALARLHRNQGKKVRIFKVGPDFLDPMILRQASGNPVYQLDLWMGGEDHCRKLLYEAAQEVDLILIEGVMGLFDGNSSSADLAKRFNIPVLAVINASAMAQTFGALAYGLANYDKTLPFAGVLANRVGSENHKDMLLESLPKDMPFYGALFKNEAMSLPSRHLGLHQAAEIQDLDQRLEHAAAMLADNGQHTLPNPVAFEHHSRPTPSTRLDGYRIAIAQDSAFSFVYQANLDLLSSMGAELQMFSPLTDDTLPEADSLYLPGGYPELHLATLSANTSMRSSIQQHAAAGKPIVAECGGMLYLLESLTDKTGNRCQMLEILPGHAIMQNKLANLGMHSLNLPEGEFRGHTYHHSHMTTTLEANTLSQPQRKKGKPEAIWRTGAIFASYLHLYLPHNPNAAAKLFAPNS